MCYWNDDADNELDIYYFKKYILDHLPTVNGEKVYVAYLDAGQYRTISGILIVFVFFPTKTQAKMYYNKYSSIPKDVKDKLLVELGGSSHYFGCPTFKSFTEHYRSIVNIPED